MITVFTPTYNRETLLERCYKSLVEQTSKQFSWLVVDDGSTDATEKLVKKWQQEGKIRIDYIKQKNSGKHVAHNTGVMRCKTELFICLDSDDYFRNNAIEIMNEDEKELFNQENNLIAGIAYLKGDEHGKPSGTYMPKGFKEISIFDLYERKHFKGELALLFKTKVLRQFLFPVFLGEKFVGESVIYDLISEQYRVILKNNIFYLYEYKEDGYTRNIDNIYKNNPKGYLFFLNQRLELAKSKSQKKRAVVQYSIGCWRIHYTRWFKEAKDKKLVILTLPIAFKLYIKLKLKQVLIH